MMVSRVASCVDVWMCMYAHVFVCYVFQVLECGYDVCVCVCVGGVMVHDSLCTSLV